MADAEDAMGEAMLEAVQAFPDAEDPQSSGLLLRLVHNACIAATASKSGRIA